MDETGSRQWLIDNSSLRMDANNPLFPASRREFHQQRYRFASRFCEGKQVLDAACGTGYGTHILAETADSVCGVDLCAEAIRYARSMYGAAKIHFEQSCVELTNFPDQSFDVVVSFETLEHTLSPAAALEELTRVLRPDGTAVLSVPNGWGFTENHFVDFDLAQFQQLTADSFEEQEFHYDNSGDLARCQPRGIGPLDELGPDQAECLIAVCRGPRHVPDSEDRTQRLMEAWYAQAMQRHREFLQARKSAAQAVAAARANSHPQAAPAAADDRSVPGIVAGGPLRLDGDDFGTQTGQVQLRLEGITLPVPVLRWSPATIEIQLPAMSLEQARPAQLEVRLADGRQGMSPRVRLLPPAA